MHPKDRWSRGPRGRMAVGSTVFTVLVSIAAVACASSRATDLAPAAPEAASAQSPGGSLDGRFVFIRSSRAGDVQSLFVVNANGSGQRQLTQPGEVCCLDRVSPDGTLILVMPAGDPGLPVTGGTIDIDGSNFQRLVLQDPTLNLVPQAWSPDGERIAFEGWDESDPSRTGVYTARASDGGDLVRVTSRDGFEHDMPLDYSPDGTQLVFYRSVEIDPGPIDIGGSLWVVGVDGSNPHEISGDVAPNCWARWSPDGSKIIFDSERKSAEGALWTVRPDGSGLTGLFEDRKGRFPILPVWSPDGAHVLFALDRTNDQFIHRPNAFYVIAADGSGLRLVLKDNTFKTSPEWWE
jgi:Tol biopolymer transport system component